MLVNLQEEKMKNDCVPPVIECLDGDEKAPTERIKRVSNPFYVDSRILVHKTKTDGYRSDLLVLPNFMYKDIRESVYDACTRLFISVLRKRPK